LDTPESPFRFRPQRAHPCYLLKIAGISKANMLHSGAVSRDGWKAVYHLLAKKAAKSNIWQWPDVAQRVPCRNFSRIG
jgi:hypothetical protein